MATITLYASKINNMSGLLRTAKSSVGTFNEGLGSLVSSALSVDSGVCSLDDTINALRSSTDTQEDKISALETFAEETEYFADEAARIDSEAAEAINSSKDDFYDDYYYLKPDSEKSGWEKFKDGLKDIGEWCKEHWKEIVLTIVIIVGVVLAVAAVIASGGLALVPLLTALGVSASAAAAISTGVAVVAVSSAIIAGVLNVGSLWGGFQSEGWQKFRTVMNWVSCISNLTYSVGMLYNNIYGISNSELSNWTNDPDRLIPVTRWGRPGLQDGDWVMRGGKNPWNYFWSGKWQPGFGNRFAWPSSGTTYWVPKSSIHIPTGGQHFFDKGAFAVIKWLLGQCMYK